MTKLFWISCIILGSLGQAFAAFNEVIVIQKISTDGESFVFKRKEGSPPWNGITLKDPQTKATLYEARVLKCSASACMAQIVKNHSGIALREDEEYLHSYNDKPIVYAGKPVTGELKDTKNVPKPVAPIVETTPIPPVEKPAPPPVVLDRKPEPKVIAKVPPEDEQERKKSEGYLAYGSPLGPGLTLGYVIHKDRSWYGVNYGNVSSTTNDVSLKGHLLSGLFMYNMFNPTPSTGLNFLIQAGLAKTTLDFSGVESSDGPTEDELTYFAALGGEGRYTFKKFSLAAKIGMNKSGFAQNYKGEQFQYTNPYGNILAFLEIGMYYQF